MPSLSAIRIVAIGRPGSGPEAALYARYVGRIRPPPMLVELPEARGAPAEVKRREAAALLRAVPDGSFTVALDQGGVALDTAGFVALVTAAPRPVCFLLGGAEGLDGGVLDRAARVLSLGPMTWPHLLARALLAEQLYRAYSIAAGHPYHRAGRP